MAQMMVTRILAAIYEPLFLECLYGFRPGKSMQNYYERIAIYKTELRLALKTEKKMEKGLKVPWFRTTG